MMLRVVPRFVAAMAVGALLMSLLAPAPATAHHDPGVTQTVVAFDTAWELGARATRAEMITYLDHIDQVGFTGFWFSYLSSTGLALEMANPNGNKAAEFNESTGQWNLLQAYADDIEWMLDQAHQRGLKVGFVVAWGVRYLHGDWPGGTPCQNENQGPLRVGNAADYGQQLAADFATHPAIAYWVLGGDNFCAKEDPQIWTNLAAGLRAGGTTQQITFHSSPLGDRYTEFAHLPWMDFLSVETGHCMTDTRLEQLLTEIINDPAQSFGKPVFAAEMRYEGFEPDWEGCAEHGPGRPVNATHVDADTRAALRSGVAGMMFGNHTRWLWEPGEDYIGTLGSPGEQAFLAVAGPHLGEPVIPSTSTPLTTTTTSTTTTTTSTTVAPRVYKCRGEVATQVGTSGDDVIVGTSKRDVIVGLGGDDTIDGRGGHDLICAGLGDDVVLGGPGNDSIYGGKGRDKLTGGGGQDRLVGEAGRDKLNGSGGADVIDAGAGNDRLQGGKGDDNLRGGSGADNLIGGPGKDKCNGGTGNNRTKSCP